MADFTTNNNNNNTSTTTDDLIEAQRKYIHTLEKTVVQLEKDSPLHVQNSDEKIKLAKLDKMLKTVLNTIVQFGNTNAAVWKKMNEMFYVMDKFSQKSEPRISTELDEIDEYLRLRGLEKNWDSVLEVLKQLSLSISVKSSEMVKMAEQIEKCRKRCIKNNKECNIGKTNCKKMSLLNSSLRSFSNSVDLISPAFDQLCQCIEVDEWMKEFNQYFEDEKPAPKRVRWNDVLVDELSYLESTTSLVTADIFSLSPPITALDNSFNTQLDWPFRAFEVESNINLESLEFDSKIQFFEENLEQTTVLSECEVSFPSCSMISLENEADMDEWMRTFVDYEHPKQSIRNETEGPFCCEEEGSKEC